MKVLLCGEGAHDIGEISYWSINQDQVLQEEGWLQPLLRKELGADLSFEILPRGRLVRLPGVREATPRPPGHGLKAAQAKRRALQDGCDLLIFMIDVDSADESRWRQKRQEIIDGFASLEGHITCVACCPMSASESWLLADPLAWCAISGKDVELPQHPEVLWGRPRDRRGNHPKETFERKCREAGISADRAARSRLMELTSLVALHEKCPTSYPQFSADLASAVPGST